MRKILIPLLLVIPLGAVNAIFCRCDSTTGTSDRSDTSVTSVDSTGVIAPPAAEAEEINSFALYFDNSGSMLGYVGKKQKPVADNTLRDMITAFGQDFLPGKPFKANLCCKGKEEKTPRTGISYDDFYKMIMDKSVPGGSESLLDQIMSDIVSKRRPGELSVFITDGIISGPAVEITKNPEYTREKIGDLESRLRNSLMDKGIAASIYAFDQEFNGVYWNYKNDTKPIDNKRKRPLYCVVVGSPAQVAQFKGLVESGKYAKFVPKKAAHNIVKLPVESGIRLQKHGGAVKPGIPVTYSYTEMKKKGEDYIKVSIDVDKFDNVFDASHDWTETASQTKVKVGNVPRQYPVVYNGSSSMEFSIPLSDLLSSGDDVEVTIPYSREAWITSVSTTDDINNYNDYSTFMFDRFANAVLNGVNGTTVAPDMLFQQTFRLERK